MKIAFAILVSMVVVNQWDESFNHGVLTRTGWSLARELGRAFGF